MSKETDDQSARAAEIEDAIKKADAAKKDAAELTERRKADGDMGTKLDKLLSHLDSTSKRMDAIEARCKKADDALAPAVPTEEEPETMAVNDDDDDLSKLTGGDRRTAEDKRQRALADAQSRCDDVAQSFGKSAPRPMDAERVLAYRQRLLNPYLPYSREFKEVDIYKINDPVLLAAMENKVYADAVAASCNPIVPEDRLEERHQRDASGRSIITFFGQPRVWMRQFSGQPQAVTAFRQKFD